MRGGPRVRVRVKWLGTPRCTLVERGGNQPSPKISKMLKPSYTGGISILEVGITPTCLLNTAQEKERYHTPHTRIALILSYCACILEYSLCISLDLGLAVLRESGHFTLPRCQNRKRIAKTVGRKELCVANLNLQHQRTQTGIKVSDRDPNHQSKDMVHA